jgi:HEAT repeat protein
MPGQIFISYCHSDGDFAENLVSKLKENGFEIWMDETGLEGGDEWREEIDRSIRDSSALVLVVTPESKDSFYVTYEWIFALGAGLKVVPIKLKETEPHPRLKEIHHHDFTNRKARPWDKLIADLKAICAREQRKKGDIIAEAKQACSIEIPLNCPPIIEKAIMTLDSVTMNERRDAIFLLFGYDQPLSKKLLLSAMKKHPLNDVRYHIAEVLGNRRDKEALPELIEALKDIDIWVRCSAAEALGNIGDSVAVPGLIEALKDIDNRVRRSALTALVEIGDTGAVPGLIEALKDTDNWVRCRAAEALGQIGDKVAVPGLIEALKDKDYEVRRSALTALVEIGDTEAVPALILALKDTDIWVRFSAAEALGKFGDKVAVPGLIEALKDTDDLVRRNAVEALVKIGDKVPVVALLEVLKDPNREVRKSAVEALEKFGIKLE